MFSAPRSINLTISCPPPHAHVNNQSQTPQKYELVHVKPVKTKHTEGIVHQGINIRICISYNLLSMKFTINLNKAPKKVFFVHFQILL